MRQFADGLLAGVDEVGIFLALIGKGANAKHAVFALQRYGHARRNIVGHQRRNADAQIDVKAILQFARGAGGHFIAGPAFNNLAHYTVSLARVVRNSMGLS